MFFDKTAKRQLKHLSEAFGYILANQVEDAADYRKRTAEADNRMKEFDAYNLIVREHNERAFANTARIETLLPRLEKIVKAFESQTQDKPAI